jgi:hypothetical protein
MASKRELRNRIKKLKRELRSRVRTLGRCAEVFIKLSDDLVAAEGRFPSIKATFEPIESDSSRMVDMYQSIVAAAWSRTGDILPADCDAQAMHERLREMLRVLIDRWFDFDRLKQTVLAADRDGWTEEHRKVLVSMARSRRAWYPEPGDLLVLKSTKQQGTLHRNTDGRGWQVMSWGIGREGMIWNNTLDLINDSRIELLTPASEAQDPELERQC